MASLFLRFPSDSSERLDVAVVLDQLQEEFGDVDFDPEERGSKELRRLIEHLKRRGVRDDVRRSMVLSLVSKSSRSGPAYGVSIEGDGIVVQGLLRPVDLYFHTHDDGAEDTALWRRLEVLVRGLSVSGVVAQGK